MTVTFVPAKVNAAGLSPVDEMLPPCGLFRVHEEKELAPNGVAVSVVDDPEKPVVGLAEAVPPVPAFTVIEHVPGRLKLKLLPSCETGISIGVDE